MLSPHTGNELKLSDFIGHDLVRENLSIMISAAKQRREALGHLLFAGPSGMGKHTLACVVANEMGINGKSTTGYELQDAGQFAMIVTNLHAGDLLLVDEVHTLKHSIQEPLRSVMEDFSLQVIIGKGTSAKTVQLKIPHITVIGTTTRLALINPLLLGCFPVIYHLDSYDDKSIQAFIRRAAVELQFPVDQSIIEEITKRANGSPRSAVRHLRWLRDYVQVRSGGRLDLDIARTAFKLMNTDE